MSQEPPPLAPRIAEDDSDDEDPATELDAAGDTRRIIDGIIQCTIGQSILRCKPHIPCAPVLNLNGTVLCIHI